MKTQGRRKSDNMIDIRPKDGMGFYAQAQSRNMKEYNDRQLRQRRNQGNISVKKGRVSGR